MPNWFGYFLRLSLISLSTKSYEKGMNGNFNYDLQLNFVPYTSFLLSKFGLLNIKLSRGSITF